MTILIRQGTEADRDQVRQVLVEAFAEDSAANSVENFVDLLRASPGYIPDLDLVAVDGTAVIGHVLLSYVHLHQPDGTVRDLLCLAPLAVHPACQGRGVGRALVEHALRMADQRGEPIVTVEGNPALYGSFGFVSAEDQGLRRPSPTIPDQAYQAYLLSAHDLSVRGRVRYPAVFWAACAAGIPEQVEATGPFAVPWLYHLARYCGWVEAVAATVDLAQPVPTCPGWTVGDVLTHVGAIHRLAVAWIQGGHRPASPQTGPADGDVLQWFGLGWRDLYRELAAAPHGAPAATWAPWDTTIGFWRRRMVHEIAIHAHDVLDAVGADPLWSVPDAVALDGIDEALRLFLGRRLGRRTEGSGGVVRIEADGHQWTVGLNRGTVEVHSLPDPPRADATVTGTPGTVYAWLWARGTDRDLTLSGDPDVISELRQCLALAMA